MIDNHGIIRNPRNSSATGTMIFCMLFVGLGLAGRQKPTPAAPDNHRPLTQTYSAAYNPNVQGPAFAESREFKLSLEGTGNCERCAGGKSFLFKVSKKANQETWSFSVADEMAQIDEVHIVNSSRVVVVGRATPHASLVHLVDFTSGKVLDKFLCYRPRVSPDSRFVAYVKFYPEHLATPYSLTDEYLVYDLTVSPMDNREGKSEASLMD